MPNIPDHRIISQGYTITHARKSNSTSHIS